jgi:hypothetical protein
VTCSGLRAGGALTSSLAKYSGFRTRTFDWSDWRTNQPGRATTGRTSTLVPVDRLRCRHARPQSVDFAAVMTHDVRAARVLRLVEERTGSAVHFEPDAVRLVDGWSSLLGMSSWYRWIPEVVA